MSKKATEFLKECIADAVLELLREKPLEKITADEICKRSGVGRATYFRHFKSKEDAIRFKRTLLWQRYCSRTGITVKDRFFIGNAKLFFNFIFETKDMVELLYSTGNERLLISLVYSYSDIPSLSSEERYREKFLLSGLIGLLDTWVRSGFSETPEQMEEILHNIITTIRE